MKLQKVGRKVADLAKTVGFNEEVEYVYGFGMIKSKSYHKNILDKQFLARWNHIDNTNYTTIDKERIVSAPNQHELQKWMRDRIDVNVHVTRLEGGGYMGIVHSVAFIFGQCFIDEEGNLSNYTSIPGTPRRYSKFENAMEDALEMGLIVFEKVL